MAWLVWNGVVVDGFEGGRLSVPSSLLRFYPARCAGIPPCCCCCCCVCSPCGRGRAGRPCPAKSPPIKVCLTSPPSPREKETTAQATPKRRWLSDKSEKRASLIVTRGPSKLAKQLKNHKTVAHIINPGKITRFVHATDLA